MVENIRFVGNLVLFPATKECKKNFKIRRSYWCEYGVSLLRT